MSKEKVYIWDLVMGEQVDLGDHVETDENYFVINSILNADQKHYSREDFAMFNVGSGPIMEDYDVDFVDGDLYTKS